MWENDCVCLCVSVLVLHILYIYTEWGMTYVNIYNSSWMFLQKLWGKLQHILLINVRAPKMCSFVNLSMKITRKCVTIWSGILPSITLRETAKYRQRACTLSWSCISNNLLFISMTLCIPRNDAYNSNYNAVTTEFAKKAAVD